MRRTVSLTARGVDASVLHEIGIMEIAIRVDSEYRERVYRELEDCQQRLRIATERALEYAYKTPVEFPTPGRINELRERLRAIDDTINAYHCRKRDMINKALSQHEDYIADGEDTQEAAIGD